MTVVTVEPLTTGAQDPLDVAEVMRFDVTVDEAGMATSHRVTMTAADYRRWTGEAEPPVDFVQRVMGVLLEHVPRDELTEQLDLAEAGQLYADLDAELEG